MPSPILRQRSFLRPLDAEREWGPSWFSSLASGFALGSVQTIRDAATLITALLQPIPDWTSTDLEDPFFIDETAFNQAPGTLRGKDLVISASGDSAWLSLSPPEDQENLEDPENLEDQESLLVYLTQLADQPLPSAAYAFDYPIEQLLLSGGAQPSLITLGNSIPLSNASTGPAQLSYPLTSDDAAPLSNPTTTSLKGEILDSVAIEAAQPQDPALVTVTATGSLASEANPEGESNVWISTRAKDGSLLWQALLGNRAVEPLPRVAAHADPDDSAVSVYVGATQNASLHHNLDGGSQDIELVSYSAEGKVLWRRILGDGGDQELIDLQLTDDGTLLVLGLTTARQSDEGIHGQNLQGNGEDVDAFLTAYSPEGSRLWTHQFGSDRNDMAIEMDLTSLPDIDAGTGQVTLTDSIVVAGWRDPAPGQIGDTEAWIELLTLPDTNSITPALLPPPIPALDWTQTSVDVTLGVPLLVARADQGNAVVVSLQGTAEPGNNLSIRLAQSDGTELASATSAADAEDGRWQIAMVVDGLSASQLGEAIVLVDATSGEGLQSDTLVEPVLLTGVGLPGELPQALPIDPDGPDGDQAPSLLLRKITRLGTGPLTTANQRLLVDYTGTFINGEVFDSSLNPGRDPFELTLGSGRVIKGWDLGLQGLPLNSSVELVIPSELAYGPTGTGSIPGGSTLVFTVDLRADLSLPTAFLSDLVWPDLFGADFSETNGNVLNQTGRDLFSFALELGAGDGTPEADSVVLSTPGGFPPVYPLLSLGGDGDDGLSSITGQAALLFGEWGDDTLTALADYAFLDGGEGNDQFSTGALLTWVRGGGGDADTVFVADGNWQLLRVSPDGVAPWAELGRFTPDLASDDNLLTQLVYLQGVEKLSGVSRFAASELAVLVNRSLEPVDASGFRRVVGSAGELLLLKALMEEGSLIGLNSLVVTQVPETSTLEALKALTNGELLLEAGAALAAQVATESLDLDLFAGLEGDAATLSQLNGLASRELVLSDLLLEAATALALLDRSPSSIDATSVLSLIGSATELQQLLSAGAITGLGEEQLLASAAISLAEAQALNGLSSGALQASLSDGLVNLEAVQPLLQGNVLTLRGTVQQLEEAQTSVAAAVLQQVQLELEDSLAALNSYVIEATDGPQIATFRPMDLQLSAAELLSLGESGVGSIELKSQASLTGSKAQILQVLEAEWVAVAAGSIQLQLNDSMLSAAELEGLLVRTDVSSVQLSSATNLKGSLEQLNSVLEETRVLGLDASTTLQVNDAVLDTSALVALQGQTSAQLEATGLNELSGSAAQLLSALNNQQFAGLSRAALQVTGTIVDAGDLADLLTASEGVLTVQGNLSGSLEQLNSVLEEPRVLGLDASTTVQFNDGSVYASALIDLQEQTSAQFEATGLAELIGSTTQLRNLLESGRLAGLGSTCLKVSGADQKAADLLDLALSFTGQIALEIGSTITGSLEQLGELEAETRVLNKDAVRYEFSDATATTSAITNFQSTMSAEELVATSLSQLTGSAVQLREILEGRVGGLDVAALLLTGSTAEAEDLMALLDMSEGSVDVSALSQIIGSAWDLEGLFWRQEFEGVTGLGDQELVVTDTTHTDAGELLQLQSLSSGLIDARSLEQLSGSATERNQVFNADRILLTLADDEPPEVVGITSSTTVIAPSSTVSFWVEFSEPVEVDPLIGVEPKLTLSNGLTANWINPQSESNTPSAKQRFDLVTGERLDMAFDVQPTALLGLEAFQDQAGNSAFGVDSAALGFSDGLTAGWTLDVDNDGQVTALGDGLMVIRHLFGGGFQGEALINKAIGPDSPYLAGGRESAAQAVSNHIQLGINSGLLDVDRDDQVTALGDGLMVIRHLFGGGFRGEALISKAISPTSSLLGSEPLNSLNSSQLDKVGAEVADTISQLAHAVP